MVDIKVRRYQDGDAPYIFEIIKKDVLKENIKDYPMEHIEEVIKTHDEKVIDERAKAIHAYVLTIDEVIVGVGMIGLYWGNPKESILLTIFINPDYKGIGLGRKIMETLESDEYYINSDRVEIPASITALEFYKHFGYSFKRSKDVFGNIVDKEGMYRLEKYPKKHNTINTLYNMRPYIDNEYHNYKEFINSFINEDNYISKYEKDLWIIELNGIEIGFLNSNNKDIWLILEYQNIGIEKQILNDIKEW